jgi:hypothetical protein
MAKTYTPIATNTLTTSAATVDFSSISGAYTDLVLVVSNLQTTSNAGNLYCRVGNGSADSGTNYSYTIIKGNGTTATSARQTGSNVFLIGGYDVGTSNTTPSMSITNIMNYSSTTTYKTALTRFSGAYSASGETNTMVQLWRSTSAINYVQVYTNAGSLAAGSTFTLY